jgi:Tfp pilus assembly protein PilN
MTAAPDFSSRGRRRSLGTADAGLLGIALLTLVLAGYATSTSWAALKRVRQDVDDTRREAGEAQARLRGAEARRSPGESLATQAYGSVEGAPPRLLADLGALLPPDVRLESLSATYGDQVQVEMQVRARTSAAYDLFLQALEASPRFGGVLPLDESRGGQMRGAVRAFYRVEPGR